MNWFWGFVFLGGVAQTIAAVHGLWISGVDFKVSFPYLVYGLMNLVVGFRGCL